MLFKLHSLLQLQEHHKKLETSLSDPVLSDRVGQSFSKMDLDPDVK